MMMMMMMMTMTMTMMMMMIVGEGEWAPIFNISADVQLALLPVSQSLVDASSC